MASKHNLYFFSFARSGSAGEIRNLEWYFVVVILRDGGSSGGDNNGGSGKGDRGEIGSGRDGNIGAGRLFHDFVLMLGRRGVERALQSHRNWPKPRWVVREFQWFLP